MGVRKTEDKKLRCMRRRTVFLDIVFINSSPNLKISSHDAKRPFEAPVGSHMQYSLKKFIISSGDEDAYQHLRQKATKYSGQGI